MVAQATIQTDDLWYVAIAPGETKVLTLEQLDDWFRLEVIDAETKVWQPGMPEWLPLSVVAGIEEPPTRPAAPPPAPSRGPSRAPSPPSPVAVAMPVLPRPPSRAVTPSGPPPPPSGRVPATPRPVAAVAPFAPAPSFAPAPTSFPAPAPVVNGPWPVALSTARSVAPVESLRPHVMSGRPMAPPRSGGGAGRWIVGLAMFAGLGITLYRNDVLREVATSTGQATTYQKLESALGGPGFGTPRAVDSLVVPASLSEAVQAAQRPVISRTETTTGGEQRSSSSSGSATTGSTGSSTSGSSSSPSLTSLMSEKLRGPSAAPERHAPAPAPRTKGGGDAAPSKNLGIKGSSNKFDPLNGKL